MARRSLPVRYLVGAIVGAQLVILFLILRDNSWVYDDNFFLVLAGQEGFTWHWLSSTQFEHWDIAMHAAYSLQHSLFFFDYRWGLVAMLAFLGGSIVVFERIIALLVRPQWIALAFALWFGLNILWIRPLQWWAAGLQYFPYTFFDLLCLYGYLRFQGGRSPKWLLLSCASLAAALLFYEKPAYMLVYLFLMQVLLLTRDLSPRSIVRGFGAVWPIWAGYLAIIAIWGAGYIHSHAYGSSAGSVPIGDYLTYFRLMWLQTLVPSLASVTIPAFHLDGLQIAFVVAAQLAVLACVALSIRRKRSAWRPWIFLAIIILVSGGLVARSRIAQFGVGIGNDPRYLVDFAWLVPVALCAAFTNGPALEIGRPVARTVQFRGLPATAPLLVIAALVAYVGASVASAAQLQSDWPGSESRTWERDVRRDIARLRSTGSHFVVADNATPFEIMEPFVAPYNRLSRVLAMYAGPVQVDGPLDGTLVTVDLSGTVHRAVAQPTAREALVTALDRSGEIRISGGRSARIGGEACVIADGVPAQIERRLTSPPTVGDAPYYLRMTARVWRQTSLPLYVDTGSGFPGTTDHSMTLAPRARSSIAWLGPDAPHNILVVIPPLTTVCVSKLDLVTLRNAA